MSNNPSSSQQQNYPSSTQQKNYPSSTQQQNYPTGTQQPFYPSGTQQQNYPSNTQQQNYPPYTSGMPSNMPQTGLSGQQMSYPQKVQQKHQQSFTSVQSSQQTGIRSVPVTTATTTKQTYHIPETTTTTQQVPTGKLPFTSSTRGEMHKWDNPHNISIPVITFDPNCKKCHGSGVSKSRFTGTPLPCTRCYTRQGYCKKCYGTGINYRKNKACTKCSAGKTMKNKSSSSSDTS